MENPPMEEPAEASFLSNFNSPKEKLLKLLSQGGNDICADCGSPDPKWVSSNLGVFICIKCAGVHRSLGVHISKVLSANLDDWTDEQVDILMKFGGNRVVNMKFESCLPENFEKPKPDASMEERTDFIKNKYEQQQFVHPDLSPACPFYSIPTSQSGSEKSYDSMLDIRPEKHSTVQRIHDKVHALRHGWKRTRNRGTKKNHSMAGMIEFLGLIKVNVVRGTNLVVRDMTSSDPYVVLSLGNQTVRTRVIKKNVNPVWNEQLMLSIPENIPPLKIQVYDKDRFSTDDFMGEAEIDINPLVIAATTSEISAAFYDHQSSDTSKESEDHDSNRHDNGSGNENDDDDDYNNSDNPVKDSGIITLEDGTVKQEITLKLDGAESGELEIELDCVSLTQ